MSYKMETSKFRRGDIVLLNDTNSAFKHYNLIISNDSYTSDEYGGHGCLVQTMKFSLSKPKEFYIPYKHNGSTSFILPQNIYSIHMKEMSGGTYSGYIQDECLIDLLINIHMSLCLSKVPSNTLQDISTNYNNYIESFVEKYGPIKDDYHIPKNNIKQLLESTKVSAGKPESVVTLQDQISAMTFLNIPKDIDSSKKNLELVIKQAEDILTSKDSKKRNVPRFTKEWTINELLLFYIIYDNNIDTIREIYGFDKIAATRRLTAVKKEMKSRYLLV